jgi:hypothetical protein
MLAVPDISSAPLPPSCQQVQSIISSPVLSKQSASGTPARDLWDKARLRLSGEDEEIICRYWSAGVDSVPEALLKAAKAKQKICDDERWNFQFKGYTVSLRDTADKVIIWLEKFKAIGDIAVNADPVHAGLPWAGIRLLLQVWSMGAPV